MNILEQAMARFEARPQHELDVPEWAADPTKPVTVYFKTPNAATLSKAAKESKGDSIENVARLVALVLTDADGKRLFAPLDYKELMVRTDPVALNRIAAAIMAEATIDTDAAEKN
jgi:hypothetical protein